MPVQFHDAPPAKSPLVEYDGAVRGSRKAGRVLVIDPFPGSRKALAEALEQTHDLVLCGQTDNPSRALGMVRRLKPRVVVAEIATAEGLDLIRALRRRHPRLPILVYTFLDEEWHAPRALEAGADGFLRKGIGPAGLADGIRGALEGRLVLSPRTRERLLGKCVRLSCRAPRQFDSRLFGRSLFQVAAEAEPHRRQ